MKDLFKVFFCFFIVSMSTAQTTDLIGTWNVIDFNMVNDGNNNNSNENKLKEDGSVWDLFFMENGNLKQSSNMRNGTLETHEGTWKISDNSLTFELQVDNREIELVYVYKIEENILILERSNQSGTWRVTSKFKRK